MHRSATTKLKLRTALLAATFSGLAGCVPVHAEITPAISGKVMDSVTHSPVVGAKVYCMRYPDHSVTTSTDGSFQMPPIKEWELMPIPSDLIGPFCKLITEAQGYSPDTEYVGLDYAEPRIIHLHPVG